MKKISLIFFLIASSLFAQDKNIDVLNYNLNFDFSNNFKSNANYIFTANEIIWIKAINDINSFVLNANNSSLKIESVSISGVSFTYCKDVVNITLDKTYLAG
ncbi:MAG: hypothetical protein J0M18_17680 [Ignavibacteria bacterium]|nr:hypothetical protein [Ignavibacteria bacterium]